MDFSRITKVSIVGPSGSGKSHLAREIGSVLSLPVFHMDKYYWQPNWVPKGNDAWLNQIDEETKKEKWVLDGNFSKTQEIRFIRSDLVIFLNFSAEDCMESIEKRHGRARPDLPEYLTEKEENKEELFNLIKNFEPKKKQILELKEKYAKDKFLELKTREEMNNFIEQLKLQKTLKPDISKYKGFLFDLDGTLFDTVDIWNNTDEILINRFSGIVHKNIHPVREKFLRENASTDTYLGWSQYLIDNYGLKNITASELKNIRLEIGAEFLKNLKYKEGAAELLLKLKEKGYAIALVTASSDEAIKIYKNENQFVKSLADFNLIFGNNIISNDMVENKKPEPDCYLKALDYLGLGKEECLVFEDSCTGVLSATKAGIDTCIIYDRHSDKDRENIRVLTPYHIMSFSEVIEDIK